MNKAQAKELLAGVFKTIKIDGPEEERIVFADEYILAPKDVLKHDIYQLVSDAMHESGLTHSFSYEVASRAVGVLGEVEDWDDTDAIHESVDSYTPIYNAEIAEIYTANSWAVDEAREEMGAVDSMKDAQAAWYRQIEQMADAIATKIEELTNDYK